MVAKNPDADEKGSMIPAQGQAERVMHVKQFLPYSIKKKDQCRANFGQIYQVVR